MKVLLLDTETHDIEKPCLVQLAYKNLSNGKVINELFKPREKITFGAMSIHHITNEDVAQKQEFENSTQKLQIQKEVENHIVVAHNAKFDLEVLENEGITCPYSICTRRLAYHFYDFDSHALQYLRYALDLNDERLRKLMPHDALTDIIMLEKLWNELVGKVQLEINTADPKQVLSRMINITRNPLVIRKMPFGKHKGMSMQEMVQSDRKYCDWIMNEEGIDTDIKFTILHFQKCPKSTNSTQQSLC